MPGGLRLNTDQLRALPLNMQEQVGLHIAAQMAQAIPEVGQIHNIRSDTMPKCDPRAFARCPYHKTCVSPEQADFMDGSDCDLFNKRILENPITVADKIRGMSDVELANFLFTATRACADKDCTSCPIGETNCIVMLYWLRKPEMEALL